MRYLAKRWENIPISRPKVIPAGMLAGLRPVQKFVNQFYTREAEDYLYNRPSLFTACRISGVYFYPDPPWVAFVWTARVDHHPEAGHIAYPSGTGTRIHVFNIVRAFEYQDWPVLLGTQPLTHYVSPQIWKRCPYPKLMGSRVSRQYFITKETYIYIYIQQ